MSCLVREGWGGVGRWGKFYINRGFNKAPPPPTGQTDRLKHNFARFPLTSRPTVSIPKFKFIVTMLSLITNKILFCSFPLSGERH